MSNTTKYINRQAIKRMALDLSEATRNGKFTRVSAEFLERINAKVAAIVREEVASHPSKGKTLM